MMLKREWSFIMHHLKQWTIIDDHDVMCICSCTLWLLLAWKTIVPSLMTNAVTLFLIWKGSTAHKLAYCTCHKTENHSDFDWPYAGIFLTIRWRYYLLAYLMAPWDCTHCKFQEVLVQTFGQTVRVHLESNGPYRLCYLVHVKGFLTLLSAKTIDSFYTIKNWLISCKPPQFWFIFFISWYIQKTKRALTVHACACSGASVGTSWSP